MLNITTYNYWNQMEEKDFENWNLPYDYHCVYILENGKHAYIGEARDAAIRAKEHSRDPQKQRYRFKKIHIITGKFIDKSPAEHYEALLIRLMSVDKKFQIVNDKRGYKKNLYPEKNKFELEFDKLWLQLEEKGLVKTKDFRMVANSRIYKYFPKTTLNEEQTKALKSIVHVLDSGETLPHEKTYKVRPIVLNGDAGTGKTLVAVALFYYLRNHNAYRDKSIALVVAHTAMRDVLKKVFIQTKGLYGKDVISPVDVSKKHYDIIICDEAHKLRRGKNIYMYAKAFTQANERLGLKNTCDELDWILKQSDHQILFYDKKQCVSPTAIRDSYVEERLGNKFRGVRPIELKSQMRIKAGRAYVPYIYDILYQKAKKAKKFSGYEFKLFTSFTEMREKILEKESQFGLCRLCAGYAWKWVSGDDELLPDIIIEGIGVKWNSKTKGWLESEFCHNEMGSIHTLHGLDLNYAGVVIGNDLYYDTESEKIKINRANFYDNSVEKGTTDEELREYILNIYAVLLTRAIEGTYVYICNENLREYLKSYIEVK